MPIVLAADTSTAVNTVAVCERPSGSAFPVLLAETSAHSPRRHAERLLATVGFVLDEAQLELTHVDALAIAIGPGSFTGLRIGAATWKGLALALGLPLAPIPTLNAMARQFAPCQGMVCPMLDARMKEVYAAAFRHEGDTRNKVLEDAVCPAARFLETVSEQRLENEPLLFVGEGATGCAPEILQAFPDAQLHPAIPRASAVAGEAFDWLEAGRPTDAASVSPVYLRASQAETNKLRAARQAGGETGP